MNKFWKIPQEKIGDLTNLDPADLMYRVMPQFFMEIMTKYFRLQVEGLEHVPKRGRGLICPNHSGFSGFDALILSHQIFTATGRVPRVLTHKFWFLTDLTSVPANKLGFVEATTENGLKLLNKNNLVVLFPEGEYGNFKPTSRAYHLQEFKRGFVRMALMTKSPIIPSIVIGAEETHINLRQLQFSKYLRGLVLPVPLNVLPLPAKWKIRFLEPRYLPYKPFAADDRDLVHEIAEEIQESMQDAINEELKKRGSIFF